MPTFYSILTTEGLARLAAAAMSGDPVVFHELAVGDGNGSPITPDAGMTSLVNERARVSINKVEISEDSPTTIRIEGLIPANVGGFTIREAAIFDRDGAMIAIASYPPIYKPTLVGDGVSVQEYIRILIQYSPVTAVALTVDTSVIIATVEDLDDATANRLWLWENFS
jgi:phage-related tail fiber protein